MREALIGQRLRVEAGEVGRIDFFVIGEVAKGLSSELVSRNS